jgi:flagellar protein FliS
VLSEFYASIFAQILQASQSASSQKFEHAIDCVRNVRDAWRQVARDPDANPALSSATAQVAAHRPEVAGNSDPAAGAHWTA